MLPVTQSLIDELSLIARALGSLSESVGSERTRGALLFSVEAVGRIEQRIVDLDFTIRSKDIELAACQRELARARITAALADEDFAVAHRGGSSPSA